MKQLLNKFFLFFLIVVFNFVSVKSASGAIISPPILDLSTTSSNATGKILKPGDSYEGYFEVIFREEDPEVLFLSVKRLEIEDKTGEPIISEVRSVERDTLDKWITLKTTKISKPPGTGVDGCNGCNFVRVDYTINIPPDASFGAHYAGILVSASPPSTDGASKVSIGAELVYQIFINLGGDSLSYDTKILSFDTLNGQRFFTSMPVNFVTTLQNNGNSFVVPKGFIYIHSGGERIRQAGTIFNPAGNRLFPDTQRVYFSTFSEEGFDRDLTSEEMASTPNVLNELREQTLNKYPYVYGTLKDKDQKFLVFTVPRYTDEQMSQKNIFYDIVYHPNAFFENLLYQITNFRIGVYNAKIDIFAGNQPPLSAQTSFIVVPVHLILTILFFFVVAYVYFKRLSRPRKTRKNLK